MGLIVPGLTPDTLGEIYEYFPTMTEFRVAAGVFAIGFLAFTLMVKIAVAISEGDLADVSLAASDGAPDGPLTTPSAALGH
jgi:molybdopterin-containing oxidoreductase family membrane subunit